MAESLDPVSNDEYFRRTKPESKDASGNTVLDRFAFHPATPVTGPKHDHIREQFGFLAADVLRTVPSGRHQSLALTALQESMMWCNAAIACDTPKEN